MRRYIFPLFFLLSSACGGSFTIDKFSVEFISQPNELVRNVVTYDCKKGAFQKKQYQAAQPQSLLSDVSDFLTPAKKTEIDNLLNKLAPDNYSSSYTKSPSAGEIDQSYVDSTFFSGKKIKHIMMNTAAEKTVPSPLLDFCNAMRTYTFF